MKFIAGVAGIGVVTLAILFFGILRMQAYYEPASPDPVLQKQARTRIPVFVQNVTSRETPLVNDHISAAAEVEELEGKDVNAYIAELEARVKQLEAELQVFHEQEAKTAVQAFLQLTKEYAFEFDRQTLQHFKVIIERLEECPSYKEVLALEQVIVANTLKWDDLRKRELAYSNSRTGYSGNTKEWMPFLIEQKELAEWWNAEMDRILGGERGKKVHTDPPHIFRQQTFPLIYR